MDVAGPKIAHQDPLVGTTILDKYVVLSVLGEGGWGIVYKAKHKNLDRLVAIKTMHAHFARDAEKIKRFEQEARAASALRNEHVAQVYDFGVLPNGQPYFVMDFVNGSTLGAILRAEPSLAEERALTFFRMICQGLEAAHAAGIVHRDIKPSNIFIVQDSAKGESVRLIDFGLAKLVTPDGNAADHLTQTGETIGTPQYMSPEQCTGRQLDARSDIYSLGCVMYESLTGHVAFNGQSAFECMSMQVSEAAKPFRLTGGKKVNPAVEAIVMRCLEKKPENRYQTVHELLHDLNVLPKPSLLRKARLFKKQIACGIAAVFAVSALAFSVPMMVPKKQMAPRTVPITVPSSTKAMPAVEHHFPINPKSIKIVKSQKNDSYWLISNGREFLNFPDLASAKIARNILSFYGATELVTIGKRGNDEYEYDYYEMVYFLTPHGAPRGPMQGEDNTGEYDPRNVKVELEKTEFRGEVQRAWKVTNGEEFMMDFGDDEAAAKLAVERINKYGFRYMCFFPYADASKGRVMPYFRS
jgi:serine/threonine protein kinase